MAPILHSVPPARERDTISFAAPTSVYLHADAKFEASRDSTGRTVVEIRDAQWHTLFTMTLDEAALGGLLTSIAETRPDVKIRAQHVAGAS